MIQTVVLSIMCILVSVNLEASRTTISNRIFCNIILNLLYLEQFISNPFAKVLHSRRDHERIVTKIDHLVIQDNLSAIILKVFSTPFGSSTTIKSTGSQRFHSSLNTALSQSQEIISVSVFSFAKVVIFPYFGDLHSLQMSFSY